MNLRRFSPFHSFRRLTALPSVDPRVLEGLRRTAAERLEASIAHLVEVLSTRGEAEVQAALAAIPDRAVRRAVRRRVLAVRLAHVPEDLAMVRGVEA